MYVPDSYRTSAHFAALSSYGSLVSSFCALGQMFAADSFQIPPRDGHPCLSGYTIPAIRARWGLTPVRQYSCRAYKKRARNDLPLRTRNIVMVLVVNKNSLTFYPCQALIIHQSIIKILVLSCLNHFYVMQR